MCFFAVRNLREELVLLHEPASELGEVVKPMGANKILVKVSIAIWIRNSEISIPLTDSSLVIGFRSLGLKESTLLIWTNQSTSMIANPVFVWHFVVIATNSIEFCLLRLIHLSH